MPTVAPCPHTESVRTTDPELRGVRERRRAALVAGSVVAALFVPVMWRLTGGAALIRGQNDLPGSLSEAAWSSLVPLRLSAPHFLLPVASRIVGTVTGLRAGMVIVVVGAAATLFGAIAASVPPSVHRSGWLRGVAVALLLFFFETPALLLLRSDDGSPLPWWAATGLAEVHHWASPTSMLCLAVTMPLGWLLVREVGRLGSQHTPTPRTSVAIAALTVASALAKPSLVLAGLLAVPCYLALRRGRGAPAIRLALSFEVPAAAVLAWQTWFLGAQQSPFDSAGGWRIEPGWVFTQEALHRPTFYLVLLVVPLAALVDRRRYVADPFVSASLVLWVAALGPTLLLRETGAQASDGNFTVGSQLAFFLVAAATFRWLASIDVTQHGMRTLDRAWWVRRAPIGVFLVAGLVAGVLAYLDAIGAIAVA